jgi:hypothetical protein
MAIGQSVHRHSQAPPSSPDQWVLELPTGAILTAPMAFDSDGDLVFSLPKDELRAYVALPVEIDPTEMDFRLLPDGGFEIDLSKVVVDWH